MTVANAVADGRIKVACIGNSVTYGYGIEGRDSLAYPAQLQRMLGDNYEVRNFGKSGATLLRHGHRPYNEQEEYRKAAIDAVRTLSIDVGIPTSLKEIVKEEDLSFLADSAMADACRPGNPKEPTKEDIIALYRSLM